MEISAKELEELFTKHREHIWRWDLGIDEATKWPISIDVTIRGYGSTNRATVILKEHVGPETRREAEIPLSLLLDFSLLLTDVFTMVKERRAQ